MPKLLAVLLATACAERILAPTADPGDAPKSAVVGKPVQLDGSLSSDPNGRPLSFRWSFVELPSGSVARLNDAAARTPSFVPDVPGAYKVDLVVSNGVLASDPAEISIEVSACGAAPPIVENVRAEPAAPATGAVVQLAADASDADNVDPCAPSKPQALRWWWSLSTLPAGSRAALNQPTAETPSFVADVPGTFVAQVIVTDSTGRASAPGAVTIDAAECGSRPPAIEEITVTPEAPIVDDVVRLVASAADPDNAEGCALGQALAYSWSLVELPSGSAAAFNDASAATPSFAADAPGDYVLVLDVTDSTGLTASEVIAVAVDGCGGNVPVISSYATEPSAPNTLDLVTLSVDVFDDDNTAMCGLGQTLSYAWSIVGQPPGSLAALNNPAAERPSLVADEPGGYMVVAVVTDSTGRAGAATPFSFEVDACGGAAPTATLFANPTDTPAVGETVQLSAEVADDDIDDPACDLSESFAYAWSIVTLPSGSTAAVNDSAATNPSMTPDRPGAYTVALVVTDSRGVVGPPATMDIVATDCG
ncbi:MAG: PKD domain-containing protein, partial [Myxococcota bacterium]